MTKILWVDFEMTGLDVQKERIIEVAALVSDLNFNELDQYHSVVHQDQNLLDRMDDWNKKTHAETGLLKKIQNGKKESVVDKELALFVRKNFAVEKPVLGGNSIGQDRLFIDAYLPEFSKSLHYRMLDVTSWKVIMANKFGIKFEKKNTHMALDDIRESISELKHYLQYFKSP